MKLNVKVLNVILALFVSWGILAGCETKQKNISYQSYIADVSSGSIGIDAEGSLWPVPDSAYVESKAKSNGSVVFMGKRLVGEYLSSTAYPLTTIIADTFYTDNGIAFRLNNKTGELLNIKFSNQAFFDTEPLLEEVDNPEENAIATATEIAKQYIEISDYERTVELDIYCEGTEEEIKSYVVKFQKYIQGYPTRDWLTVKVTSKGNLEAFSLNFIGELDDISVEIDKQKVNDSVMAKINEKYTKTSFKVLDIHIRKQTLAKTQAGDPGIYSEVNLTVQQGDFTYDSVVGVFTYLPNA